jgi:transposase
MPNPLSLDLRQRIIAAYDAQEGSQRELAERFKVSLSFIRDLRRHQRETGQLAPKPHGGGSLSKLSPEHCSILADLVAAQPDATLEELCDRLSAQAIVQVSVPTMYRVVQKLGLSVKKTKD